MNKLMTVSLCAIGLAIAGTSYAAITERDGCTYFNNTPGICNENAASLQFTKKSKPSSVKDFRKKINLLKDKNPNKLTRQEIAGWLAFEKSRDEGLTDAPIMLEEEDKDSQLRLIGKHKDKQGIDWVIAQPINGAGVIDESKNPIVLKQKALESKLK